MLPLTLQSDKTIDFTKLKAFVHDKFNVAKMISDPVRVENIVVKGENKGFQHFLLCQQCFQSVIFLGLLKVGISGEGVIQP